MEFNIHETIRLKILLLQQAKKSLASSKDNDYNSDVQAIYREDFHLYFDMFKKVNSYFNSHSFTV